jgi:predicted MFS family arabinose efflux permease
MGDSTPEDPKRDFNRLWAAKTVSDFGSMISRTALTFTAILYLRASPLQLGVLVAANLVPRILIGPIAGLASDRLPRRALMIGSDVGRAALLATVPAAAFAGRLSMWHLYLVVTVTGLLSMLFDIADRSYLPTLVAEDELVSANSRLTASSSVAEFGAFSLGGWLVQLFTAPLAILIDAFTFVVSAVLLVRIRTAEPPRGRPDMKATPQGEIAAGWAFLGSNRVLMSLAFVTLVVGLGNGIEGAVMVAFMTRGLGFHPGVLGMIWSIGGFASLGGAVLAGRSLRRFSTGSVIGVSLLVAASGVLAVPMAHGATWLAAGLLISNQLLTDSAYTVFDIRQTSLRQAAIPDRLLGRVTGQFETIGQAAMVAGALIGGLMGERIGLRAAVAIGAAGYVAGAALVWLSPLRRTSSVPAPIDEPAS